MSVEQTINNKWHELHESYVKANGITRDEIEKKHAVEFNISRDIPNLQALIDKQPNNVQLTTELKDIIMKYYWIGVSTGFELNN